MYVDIAAMKEVADGGYADPDDKELDGLDFAEGMDADRSRLACQMKIAKCCEGQSFEMVEDV